MPSLWNSSRSETRSAHSLRNVSVGTQTDTSDPTQPDLYEVPLFHRIGPPSWSPFSYIAQTAHLAPLIADIFYQNIKFQIGSITGFFKDREEWVPRTVLGTGLMEEEVFKKMTVYSSHMYFVSRAASFRSSLMLSPRARFLG